MSSLDSLFDSTNEMDMKQKIVEELLNSETNLDTKTELNKPLKWSCLDLIQNYLGDNALPKSKEILDRFMNTSFKYLISNTRQGRKEYIEALKSLTHMEETQKPNNISALMKS